MKFIGEEGGIAEATRDLRAAVIDVVDFHANERATLSAEPSVGSRAGKDDLQAYQYVAIVGSPTKEARSLGVVQLSQAEEHIRAIDVVYGSTLSTVVADKVLVRSVLECCGRAFWLLTHELSTRERVARSLVERLNELRTSARLVPVMADHFDAKIVDLTTEARSAGFTVGVGGWGSHTVDGIARPSQAEALELVLGADNEGDHLSPGTLAQRYLSLAVHGNPAAMLLHRSRDEDLTELGGGMVLAPIEMRTTDAILVLRWCALAYMTAANANRMLMEWRNERWTRVKFNYKGVSDRYVDE